MEKVAIYGAGDFGQKLYGFLKSLGCQTELFIQSARTDIDNYEGVPVVTMEEYLREGHQFFIFISIQNRNVVNSIKNTFERHHYDMSRVFGWNIFLEENYLIGKKFPPGEKNCNLCRNSCESFLPTGHESQLFSELKVIGGGYRENAVCPYCGSLDRNRWVFRIMQEKTDILKGRCRVLHFAPEEMIRKRIKENVNCDYYAGDVVLAADNHQVDVTDIQFRDKFFDYILINHVLEHVPDERKAFDELKRVLKESGILILSFPVTLEAETFEDERISSEEDRLRYYGQKDHVRLYGKDFRERIEGFGWQVSVYSPGKELSIQEAKRNGFLPEDILLLCRPV